MENSPALTSWLPTPRPISPRLSSLLDCARWMAAALVVLNHARAIMFVDYTPGSGGITKTFYFLSGFGHHAVILFFVLSGYLVGGEVLRGLRAQTFDARHYAIKRVARLYAVYLVALILGGSFDWVGSHYFAASGIYTHGTESLALNYSVVDRLNLSTFFGNLAFCQRLLVPPFGSNEPLWSLANEAWYYLLFPLAAITLVGRYSLAVRLGCLAAFTAGAWFVRGELLAYFSIWILGLIPRFLPRAVVRPVWFCAMLVFAVLAAMRLYWLSSLSMLEQDLILAGSFVLLINAVEHTPSKVAPRLMAWHRKMANFSYTLYVLHWPFILFLVAVLHTYLGTGLRMPVLTWKSGALMAAVVTFAYLYAWLVAQVTEKRTPDLRRWLSRLAEQPSRRCESC